MEELINLGTDLESFPDNAPTFHVPENYFEQLPSLILAAIKAFDSETELNLEIHKTGPFNTPANYFDSLSDTILNKVRAINQIVEAEKITLFGETSKEAPFHLPENYFNNLQSDIAQKLGLNAANAIEELALISPLLASLRNEPSYETPNTYFNATDFSEKVQLKTIQSKVVEHPSAKSIKWARWAAAASIILIFSVSGFQFLNSNLDSSSTVKFEKSLAKISDARIKDWLSNNIDEADMSGLDKGLVNMNTNAASNLTKEQQDELEMEAW